MYKCAVCKASLWPDEVHDTTDCITSLRELLFQAEFKVDQLENLVYDKDKEISRLLQEIVNGSGY